jgi:hypothetical protein
MDRTPDPWGVPLSSRPYRQCESYLQDSALFKAFFLITYIVAFLFFLVSVFGLFDPYWSAEFNKPSPFYLFFLIINSPPINVPTIWLNMGMTLLYTVFFLAILYFGIKRWKGPSLNNPLIYYGSMASFGLFMSLLIVIIEQAMGIQIGGASIETGLQNQPYLSFVQLIFAPYAEEFGFRILPLGLLSVYYVARARGTGLDSAAAFVIPGIMRKKYGLRLTRWDYVLIIFTSILFGAAHYLLGAWDPGKIISAAFVGFILAFGFIKFGIFVDIPIHWFFNGFTTVDLIVPAVTAPYATAILWTLLSGVIATVFLIIIAIERKGRYGEDGSFREQNSFS